MTQAYVETRGFTAWNEDLYYKTPQQLVIVWDKRFTMDKSNTAMLYAPDYINNPQKLGNAVYANRMGNGNAASGDGYNFRGRGAFHLTGRSNYLAASMYIYKDDRFVQNPVLVEAPMDACMSAGWFWDINKMNALADSDSFTQSTIILNGNDRTVKDRLLILNQSKPIFTT